MSVTGVPETYNISLSGFSVENMPTIKVDMASEKGIKSLVVSISSDNEMFPILLDGLNLKEPFDLCNLEGRDDTKDNLLNLGLISEEVYAQLHAGTLTSYTFEVTSLVGMLPQSNLIGSHVFTLTISDGNETKEGALTVNVTE